MSEEKRVKAFILEQNLIRRGDRILLGLSGGADSVCLFFLLLGLREELGFELRAVHVCHGIREEAEDDAAYAEALCEREGIRFYMFRENVPAYAKEQGISEEEGGRILRYADFEECLRLWRKEAGGAVSRFKIATAHHENDQAETVLFQMFRGCGLAGLRGILPERGHIIRPILCLSKAEIERYLRAREISWCEDKTNLTTTYSRNKIRHQILSYAEREINRDASAHIARTAEIVREAERYIREQTKKAYQRSAEEEKDIVIFDIPALRREDVFLQKQLLFYGIERILATRKDIGMVHVEDILKLTGKEGNGRLFLPDGLRVQKCYQKLSLFRSDGETETGGNTENGQGEGVRKSKEAEEDILPALLSEDKGFLFGECAPAIRAEQIDLTEEESVKKRFGIQEISEILYCIPQKTYTKWFDYDKIKMPFSVRHWESGDYLTINGEMKHKSFRRYMIENKIPVSYRGRIWLLADESHVIWVPGGRISEYYKVTAQTKTILQVKICGEE